MRTAALFTIARTWKQPKCPLTDEWIKKKWYIYTMEYYSATHTHTHTHTLNNAICSNKHGPKDNHTSKVSQRKTNIIYRLYVESNLKTDTKKLIKQTYRYQKQTYGYQRENMG